MTRAPRVTCAALLAPLLTLTTACEPTMLAPPPLLPATAPVVADDATVTPVAGFTRVRVSTDLPARVYLHAGAVGGRNGPHAVQTVICETTPCAFTVPYGAHELTFEGTGSTENAVDERARRSPHSGTAIVHANAPEVVVNETLGWEHSPPGRALGGTLMVLGTITTIIGLALASKKTADPGTAGIALGGASSFVLGGIILAAVPPVEQPSVMREWNPPAPATSATVGGSLGFRF